MLPKARFKCTETNQPFLSFLICFFFHQNSRERPFICQECGRSFPLKRHLVTHSKFHAGERPYVCDECGESFAQENHLIMHSRFHGSLNPFVCSDCGATFPRKFQLVNHGRIHGRVPHSCTVCGKEFLQKRTLVAHMRLYVHNFMLFFSFLFFSRTSFIFRCVNKICELFIISVHFTQAWSSYHILSSFSNFLLLNVFFKFQ